MIFQPQANTIATTTTITFTEKEKNLLFWCLIRCKNEPHNTWHKAIAATVKHKLDIYR